MGIQKQNTPPRIVVLGGGLGGTIAAYEIKAAVRGRAEIMLVSDRPQFNFVPSNPWVAVHWRDLDDLAETPTELAVAARARTQFFTQDDNRAGMQATTDSRNAKTIRRKLMTVYLKWNVGAYTKSCFTLPSR